VVSNASEKYLLPFSRYVFGHGEGDSILLEVFTPIYKANSTTKEKTNVLEEYNVSLFRIGCTG
jgi:hypothetical protein